jgi:hypothetical protein
MTRRRVTRRRLLIGGAAALSSLAFGSPPRTAGRRANLYVSGGSVFPVSGTTNPTDTVAALTLRLGDHSIGRIR